MRKVNGESIWNIVQECEAAGTYFNDKRYSEIFNFYSEHLFSRLENEGCNDGTPSDASVTGHEIPGLSVYDSMWGQSEFSCTGTLKGYDSTRLLREITVPVLYICGEYDCGTPGGGSVLSIINT